MPSSRHQKGFFLSDISANADLSGSSTLSPSSASTSRSDLDARLSSSWSRRNNDRNSHLSTGLSTGLPTEGLRTAQGTSTSPEPIRPEPRKPAPRSPERSTGRGQSYAESSRLQEIYDHDLSSYRSSGDDASSQGNTSTLSPDKEKEKDKDKNTTKRQRDVAKMASVLMNMKYAHFGELQDTEPQSSWPVARSPTPEDQPSSHPKLLHLSASTRSRVSRTKAYFQLKYQMIESFQQPLESESYDGSSSTTAKDLHTRGVYNPLQVIRNRKENKAAQTIVENSGFQTPKAWTIDPTELVRDWAWRSHNLNLLKDRKGRPIYDDDLNRKDYTKTKRDHKGYEELDLFPTTSAGSISKSYVDLQVEKVKRRFHRKGGSSHNDTDSSFSKSDVSDADDSFSGDYKRGHSPVRDVQIERLPPYPHIVVDDSPNSPVKQLRTERSNISIAENTSKENLGESAAVNETTESSRSRSRSKSVNRERDSDDHQRTGYATSISGSSEHSKSSSKQSRDTSNSKHGATTSTTAIGKIGAAQDRSGLLAAHYNKELFYLEALFRISAMKYSRIVKTIDNLAETDDRSALTALVADSSKLSTNVNTNLLPASESFINSRLPDVNILRNDMVHEKLPKMDTMLSESDRILGETTTTLSLDIRRLGERINRMERRVTNLKLVRQVAYKLLAYVVVLIMWIIWCLVTLILIGKSTVKGVVSSVKWLLWC